MGAFEILEHTADVGVIATGDTFAEALGYVAEGMFSLIADLESVQPKESLKLSVQSIDTDALVVDWLNELLYRFDGEGFLPREFEVTLGKGERSLVARCMGERVDPERHTLKADVKAATYHSLEVSHNGEWRIQVVLDV